MTRYIIATVDKIDLVLSSVEKFLICVTLTVMLVMASMQVILRNFFDSGIGWGDIFVRHMVLFLLFFGASLSTREKRHIQMDVSSKITPKKLKPLVSLIINSFCIIVNFYLAKSSYLFLLGEIQFPTILFAKVPTWYFISIMPVGFGIITFRFFLNWIENILVLLRLKEPSKDGHEVMMGA